MSNISFTRFIIENGKTETMPKIDTSGSMIIQSSPYITRYNGRMKKINAVYKRGEIIGTYLNGIEIM